MNITITCPKRTPLRLLFGVVEHFSLPTHSTRDFGGLDLDQQSVDSRRIHGAWRLV
jgi:hypothetical protein